MKVCIITNYIDKGYVNELLILDNLISTLNLQQKDIYSISDVNLSYSVNKNYTHVLVLLDFKITSLLSLTPFLDNIFIPKIFVIDTIPEIHKNIDVDVLKHYDYKSDSSYNSLSKNSQNILYNDYADALIFYSNLDFNLFTSYYEIQSDKKITIIPPSLGKEKSITFNPSFFKSNNNIGFNGIPSFNNGFGHLISSLASLSDYNLNIYGKHGRSPFTTQPLINNATASYSNICFKGQLRDSVNFYKNNHIYANVGLYNSFDLPTLYSIVNGMVPIISPNLPISEFLPNYPFVSNCDYNEIIKTIIQIKNTSDSDLKDILYQEVNNIKFLNDNFLKEKYHFFLNSL